MHKFGRAAAMRFLALLCLSLVFTGCQGKGGGARGATGADSLSARAGGNGDAIPVEVAEAAKRDVSLYLTATSTLEAERTAQLLAETTGRVTAVHREEGDGVAKGRVIIQLENTQQKLDFQKAEIDMEVAEKEWRRAEELEKKGIVSAKDLDEARLRFEAARHAKARAEYELSKTAITAPFAGIVTERNVNIGETVTPGKAVATVADFDPLVAKFRVPETEIGPVKVGQPVTLEIPSRQNNTQHAQVSLVSPVIDEGTGTVKLTAYLKNPGYGIKPGTFVRARVVAATHDSALTIPKRALVSEDDSHYVFTVASDTTRKVAVTPGITDGQYLEILSGLSAGDRVITVGQGGLKPGDKVRVVK
ncbi:MAG: efflux RND transporter periplasmic adaptor subunit [Candidatus Eisenbacteria bacterium]|nr:efflux RND transporter periplasmic adaptor subunit [Candidatus Eisenbacteria bacterium]